MAATVADIYKAVVTGLAAELGVPVRQAFPTWGRTQAETPCAAVEIYSWQPGSPARVGQRVSRHSVQFRVWLFARHETELATLLTRFALWADQGFGAAVVGARVSLGAGEAVRHEPGTDADAEAHAMWSLVTATWSIEG